MTLCRSYHMKEEARIRKNGTAKEENTLVVG